MVFNGMERILILLYNFGLYIIKYLGKLEIIGNFFILIIRFLGDLINILMFGYVVFFIELKSVEYNRIVLYKWIVRGDVNSM